MRFQETRRRSIVKSVSFRVLVVVSDTVVIYAITRHVGATIALTIATNVASTILYFLHERSWDAISWGRRRVYLSKKT
ncbi:MAG TPA: DUF2061 domain-containing protein [Candidatus Saccharimonadales bacterium]|nr:DUF2061 domain-containing protein [Candidatus Saccharimonadales bacterium]